MLIGLGLDALGATLLLKLETEISTRLGKLIHREYADAWDLFVHLTSASMHHTPVAFPPDDGYEMLSGLVGPPNDIPYLLTFQGFQNSRIVARYDHDVNRVSPPVIPSKPDAFEEPEEVTKYEVETMRLHDSLVERTERRFTRTGVMMLICGFGIQIVATALNGPLLC